MIVGAIAVTPAGRPDAVPYLVLSMRVLVAAIALAGCEGCDGPGFDDIVDDFPDDEPFFPPDASSLAATACVPNGSFSTSSSCASEVCTADPNCCSFWDGWCAELAAECLGTPTCAQVVAVASDGIVHAGALELPLPGAGPIRAMEWLDADRDGRADLITAAEGSARMTGGHGELWFEQAGGFTAARWSDLDRDGAPDAIFAGPDAGIFWMSSLSWIGQTTILPADGAPITDLLPVDVNDDSLFDLIVTYADRPAALVRQVSWFTWELDDGWSSALSGHLTAALCDLSTSARREVVLGGPAGLEIDGVVVPGVDGITDVACGHGEVGVVGADRPIRIVSADGAVTWDSSQLDPPVVVRGAGIGFGWLGGQPTWAITVEGAAGDVPYLLLRADGALDPGLDPAPDLAAGPVQLVDIDAAP